MKINEYSIIFLFTNPRNYDIIYSMRGEKYIKSPQINLKNK